MYILVAEFVDSVLPSY